LAALLHDIGHYPFSHALEEAGLLRHEAAAERHLARGELAERLVEVGAPTAQLLALIRGGAREPLAGLVAGSLDVDKLDYLSRDAWMCGVPYGVIDVDRLLMSLTVAGGPDGRPTLALHEKGLAALESLLFARYQMYRNVYWHHAVRSATAMYKRLVDDAMNAGSLDAAALAAFTDEGLLHDLARRAPSPLLGALRERRLFKRAFQCPAGDLPPDVAEWIADDPALTRRVEDALAAELGLAAGEVLLDYPTKTQMLGLDMPVQRRNGDVFRLTAEGEGAINLPKLAEEFYRSARWLRVFVRRPVELQRRSVLALATRPREEVKSLLDRGCLLLAR